MNEIDEIKTKLDIVDVISSKGYVGQCGYNAQNGTGSGGGGASAGTNTCYTYAGSGGSGAVIIGIDSSLIDTFELNKCGEFGLVSEWNLDEGIGLDIEDSIGLHDGLINSASWNSTCIDGNCLEFDALTDYTTIPSSTDFAFGEDPFSVSFWFYKTGENGIFGNKHIIGCYPGGTSDWATADWAIKTNSSNKIYFTTGTWGSDYNAVTSGENVIDLNKWHLITFVREGHKNNQAKIYVDGELVATGTIPNNIQNNYDLYMMRPLTYTGEENPTGKLDEIKIYKKALTQTEIQDYYNENANFLISEWKFDEETGIVALDSAGSNNGTLINGPTRETSNCISGNCLSFNGVNNYIDISNFTHPLDDENFTISLWANTRDTSTVNVNLMGNINDADYNEGWAIGTHNTLGPVFVADDIYGAPWKVAYFGSTALSLNKWSHLALTRSGNTFQWYENGVASTPLSSDILIKQGAYNLQIGSSGNIRYFNGLIDEVKIYNEALAEAEIQDYYNEFKPLYNQDLSNTTYEHWDDHHYSPSETSLNLSDNNESTLWYTYPNYYGSAGIDFGLENE